MKQYFIYHGRSWRHGHRMCVLTGLKIRYHLHVIHDLLCLSLGLLDITFSEMQLLYIIIMIIGLLCIQFCTAACLIYFEVGMKYRNLINLMFFTLPFQTPGSVPLFETCWCSNCWDQIPRTCHVLSRLFTLNIPWYFLGSASVNKGKIIGVKQ